MGWTNIRFLADVSFLRSLESKNMFVFFNLYFVVCSFPQRRWLYFGVFFSITPNFMAATSFLLQNILWRSNSLIVISLKTQVRAYRQRKRIRLCVRYKIRRFSKIKLFPLSLSFRELWKFFFVLCVKIWNKKTCRFINDRRKTKKKKMTRLPSSKCNCNQILSTLCLW